jgi:hypothetical protein
VVSSNTARSKSCIDSNELFHIAASKKWLYIVTVAAHK